ncbi:MAG TPA: serine/threonine-protein kinase [Gemmatimonadales bacterium]|nr:serine/threonine-protein kinase [Gemmatimonadales bacterium]
MARDLLPVIRETLADLFQVEREIARGGAARVYRAQDREGRLVALKVLHPELQVSAMAERFLREIRVASSLDHPLIAPVLDWGQRDWLVYYTMPLIAGPTLRTCFSRSRQLSVADTCRVGKDVLDALGHAHQARIMHRDVKPENIIISDHGAVLVDFGVARAVEVAAGDRVTAAGMTVGTAGYMSPEQASGAADLDYRTDLYAVGCVLFESLAGRPPFAHRNQSVVLQMQLSGEAPDVRTFRADTPEPLAQAITRALQRRAEDRWRTAVEMRSSLDACNG